MFIRKPAPACARPSVQRPGYVLELRFFAEDKYVNAGLFYAAIGRDGRSAGRCANSDARSWDAAAGLGALCNKLNRFDDAISFYEIAVQLRPGDAQYLGMLDQIRSRRAAGKSG